MRYRFFIDGKQVELTEEEKKKIAKRIAEQFGYAERKENVGTTQRRRRD